jgi:transcriptional regulator with XRE-family HTH domain
MRTLALKINPMEAPHIGNMLRLFITKHRLSQSAWARRAGITPKTVASYLKHPTMRIDTLFAVCQSLEYNFIREVAHMLPPDLAPQKPIDQTETVKALQVEIEQLKVQVATLEKALSLIGGK